MERNLESQGPFDLAKYSLTRWLENECGEIQPWNKTAFPSSQTEQSWLWTCKWIVYNEIRYPKRKEFPSNFSENLSSLSVSTGVHWHAHTAVEVSEQQSRSTIPFLLHYGSLLPRAKSNARARVLSHAWRDQDIWTLPSWLYLMFFEL